MFVPFLSFKLGTQTTEILLGRGLTHIKQLYAVDQTGNQSLVLSKPLGLWYILSAAYRSRTSHLWSRNSTYYWRTIHTTQGHFINHLSEE